MIFSKNKGSESHYIFPSVSSVTMNIPLNKAQTLPRRIPSPLLKTFQLHLIALCCLFFFFFQKKNFSAWSTSLMWSRLSLLVQPRFIAGFAILLPSVLYKHFFPPHHRAFAQVSLPNYNIFCSLNPLISIDSSDLSSRTTWSRKASLTFLLGQILSGSDNTMSCSIRCQHNCHFKFSSVYFSYYKHAYMVKKINIKKDVYLAIQL